MLSNKSKGDLFMGLINYKDIDFSENTILKLHETMMAYGGYEYGGRYKIDDNLIIEEDKNGNRKVRFKPVPAKDAPKAMEQLVLAYIDASNNSNIKTIIIEVT